MAGLYFASDRKLIGLTQVFFQRRGRNSPVEYILWREGIKKIKLLSDYIPGVKFVQYTQYRCKAFRTVTGLEDALSKCEGLFLSVTFVLF